MTTIHERIAELEACCAEPDINDGWVLTPAPTLRSVLAELKAARAYMAKQSCHECEAIDCDGMIGDSVVQKGTCSGCGAEPHDYNGRNMLAAFDRQREKEAK